jgi:hypothetical protein
MNKVSKVNFFGEDIIVIDCEVKVAGKTEHVLGVPAKRLVEQLGLAWPSQHAKLMDDEDNRYGVFEAPLISPNGKTYDSLVIPYTALNAFLFSINRKNLPEKMIQTELSGGGIREETIKQKIIRYQDECQLVLHDYWTHGAAINLRSNFADAEAQKNYDILETSRKRYENMFNGLVQNIVDSQGKRGEDFERGVIEFAGVLEEQVLEVIMTCMGAAELDTQAMTIRKPGEAGKRYLTGMEAIYISILQNCFCDLIGLFRRKEIGDGRNYEAILDELPKYFDDYLSNVNRDVLMMRNTFNRGRGLFAPN